MTCFQTILIWYPTSVIAKTICRFPANVIRTDNGHIILKITKCISSEQIRSSTNQHEREKCLSCFMSSALSLHKHFSETDWSNESDFEKFIKVLKRGQGEWNLWATLKYCYRDSTLPNNALIELSYEIVI